MNPAVSPDDEADLDLPTVYRRRKKRIRRGEGLGRTNVCAFRSQTDVADVDKLGGTREGARKLMLAFSERSGAQVSRRSINSRRNDRNQEQRNCWPDATKHRSWEPLRERGRHLKTGKPKANDGNGDVIIVQGLARIQTRSQARVVKLIAHKRAMSITMPSTGAGSKR